MYAASSADGPKSLLNKDCDIVHTAANITTVRYTADAAADFNATLVVQMP